MTKQKKEARSNLLIDTCVWLDVAKNYQQQAILAALKELIRQGDIALILPRTVVAPRLEKVGATEGGLSCLPAFPYDVAPQKPNARRSHSFLARPRGRVRDRRALEAPRGCGIQKRSGNQNRLGI